MKVLPGFFGSLFFGTGGWELALDPPFVVYIGTEPAPFRLPLETITVAEVKGGLIWSRITVGTAGRTAVLKGIVNRTARRFIAALRNAVSQAAGDAVAAHVPDLKPLADSALELLKRPGYLSHRDIETWRTTLPAADRTVLVRVLALWANPLLPHDALSKESRGRLELLSDVTSGASVRIGRRNEQFVAHELVQCQDFFDTVEKQSLTNEQRVASVVLEDCNLVVAAAGSGKTSTIVAKIGYLLRTQKYAAGDLLVLAFNNNAVAELRERIHATLKSQLAQGARVAVKTFHAFGLEIMASADGRKASVANFAGGPEAADPVIVARLVSQCIQNDPEFLSDWITFRAVCLRPAKSPADFSSLEAWNSYVRANGESHDGKRGFLTMQGEIVKSQGELAIANWLYLRGVEYEYERAYEYDTADQLHRQYHPDFYFPTIATYLEHYALDKDGRPPPAFGARYAESMHWKAELHKTNATALITTTFAEFISGELFPKLERELKARGQPFSFRPVDGVLERLNTIQKKGHYAHFLRTALKHAKSNEIDETMLQVRADSHPEPFRARIFARVLGKLLAAYQARLRQNNEIDFEDMILEAARSVAANRYSNPFKLILVDEFQDISQARAKLLKALLRQAPDCKLFAVGDDWQAIYRFAGADIEVFTQFASHFGVTATNYMTQTFRSNQGITDIAAAFVQRNPSQMRKQVQARDPASKAIVVVRWYASQEEMEDRCGECLREISQSVGLGKRASVFLLGRYSFQLPDAMEEWKAQFPMLDVTFSTVHAAKGLEADYVFVLGLQMGGYGFPSEIGNDPLLELVMPQAESFPNAEERRLFYVALTRARHGVYLLGDRTWPSAFLTELVEENGVRGGPLGSLQPN